MIRRVPIATYRLQLSRARHLRWAAARVPYLSRLGVDTLYVSPLLAARAGSPHGYDIVDPTRLNPELGSEEDLGALVAALAAHHMGLLVDIVPNHVCVDTADNPWWNDVLRRGRASAWARVFDIDWDHPDADGRLLVPLLRAPLAKSEVSLVWRGDEAFVRVGEQMFAVALNGWSGRAAADARDILAGQGYRLLPWQRGAGNYRRFADINELAAVRVEDVEVLNQTHRKLFEWVRRDWIQGFRVDHLDGLYDAEKYLRDVRQAVGDLYMVVEKPLGLEEALAPALVADGTTGYDVLGLLTGLCVRPAAHADFERLYVDEFGGDARGFSHTLARSRQDVLDGLLAHELGDRLRQLVGLARAATPAVDFVVKELAGCLRALLVSYPNGRPTLGAGGGPLAEPDASALSQAAERARALVPDDAQAALAWVVELLRTAGGESGRDFVARLAHLLSAVTAKGLEDTAFYRDARLVALNEVGHSPAHFGSAPECFHARNARIAKTHPHTVSATSTHDTKRSEDVRARLAALSEVPELWAERVRDWRVANAHFKTSHEGISFPDAREEYFIYQTLVGVWPIARAESDSDLAARLGGYFQKAFREAKVHTSWLAPRADFERAVAEFVARLLCDDAAAGFRSELDELARLVGRLGFVNSLAQVVLKIALPGVPDFYQGTEFWELNLVDPDNRRAVDFAARETALATLQKEWRADRGALLRSVLAAPGDGRLKMLVTWRALTLRQEHAALFAHADYRPLAAHGAYADNVIGLARVDTRGEVVALVCRFSADLAAPPAWPLGAAWQETRVDGVSPGRYRDAFTLREHTVDGAAFARDVFGELPVALWEKIG